MTKQKVGGYTWRRELSRARQSVARARTALTTVVDTDPGPQTRSMLLAKAALALGESMEAINEIERIVMEVNGGREMVG